MFRLHKAAIIRTYVLENIKNKYFDCILVNNSNYMHK